MDENTQAASPSTEPILTPIPDSGAPAQEPEPVAPLADPVPDAEASPAVEPEPAPAPIEANPPTSEGVLSDSPVVSIPTIVEAPKVETKGGIRRLYEGAKKLGLSVRHLLTSEDVEAAIPVEEIPGDTTTWTFDDTEIGNGPLVARSTDGKMRAYLEADGSGKLILLGYPDEFNRSDKSQLFGHDTVIPIESFDNLATMLGILVDAADPVFDASLAKLKQNSLNVQAQRANEQAVAETPPPPTDEEVHNMSVEALATKFGLTQFVHSDGSYNLEEMAPRLADAYEIPRNEIEKDKDGNEVLDDNGRKVQTSVPIAPDVLMDQVMGAARAAGDLETP